MENTKLELFHDRVFCFIKGRLIALPDGATPIDFAYAVHTAVGNKCVSAKINGNPMPLRTFAQGRRSKSSQMKMQSFLLVGNK